MTFSTARRGSEQHGDGQPDSAYQAGRRGEQGEHGKQAIHVSTPQTRPEPYHRTRGHWVCVRYGLHVRNLDISRLSVARLDSPQIGGVCGAAVKSVIFERGRALDGAETHWSPDCCFEPSINSSFSPTVKTRCGLRLSTVNGPATRTLLLSS